MKTKVENRQTYICIQVSGEFKPKDRDTLDEAKNVILEAFQQMKENQISKLLVDASRASTVLDAFDRYYLMSSLAKEQLNFVVNSQIQPFKTAFVTNQEWSDPQKFEETVAFNRGMDVLITLDVQEALSWLGV
ncbi:MAG: hypothetical protein V1767_08015 [Chloroflexota bacterium]